MKLHYWGSYILKIKEEDWYIDKNTNVVMLTFAKEEDF